MANKDLYGILGINKGASADEIKKAFRRGAMTWHPDKWGDKTEAEKKNAEERFKEITEAYEILSDKDKKAQYDMFGTTDFSGGGHSYSSDMDIDDIMSQFMGGSGFNPFNRFKQGRNHQVFRGSDKKIKISVSLEDVFFERVKTVSYEVERPCDDCGGKGTKDGSDVTCPYCGGSGMVTETKSIGYGMVQTSHPCSHCGGTGRYVKNPCKKCGGTGVKVTKVNQSFRVPSIDKLGYTYQMSGEGNTCHNGRGANGDLYFTFGFKDDPNGKYHIDEDNPANIWTSVDVSVFDCLTGCEKAVETVDGKKLTIKVPQGTKDGYEFVFNGNGFKLSNGFRGKFIVKVKMTMPQLNEKQIKKIKEIAKLK